MTAPRFVSLSDARRLTGLSRQTLRRAIADRKIGTRIVTLRHVQLNLRDAERLGAAVHPERQAGGRRGGIARQALGRQNGTSSDDQAPT